jgi:hypothetical protein
MALVTLKIALLAPMPIASERIATAVNPGFLKSVLTLWVRSYQTVDGLPRDPGNLWARWRDYPRIGIVLPEE